MVIGCRQLSEVDVRDTSSLAGDLSLHLLIVCLCVRWLSVCLDRQSNEASGKQLFDGCIRTLRDEMHRENCGLKSMFDVDTRLPSESGVVGVHLSPESTKVQHLFERPYRSRMPSTSNRKRSGSTLREFVVACCETTLLHAVDSAWKKAPPARPFEFTIVKSGFQSVSRQVLLPCKGDSSSNSIRFFLQC